jgi:hypothetical protein
MSIAQVLLLIVLLNIKHFIVDFLLQNKWQWSNKHIFGHPGGMFHAFLHGITTVGILLAMNLSIPLDIICIIGWSEYIIHYLIDWGKMNLNIKTGWKPDTSEKFWWLLGFDQLLHNLTYCAIIYSLLTVV